MAEEITPEVAPVVEAPVGAQEVTPTAEETDAQEWDAALDEVLLNRDKDKDDEPAKSEEKPKTEEAPKVDPNETPEQKAAREEEAANASQGESNAGAREARITARETAQQIASIKSDVREQMFSESPTQLVDGEGDPINTIEDVMNLINPNTGEAFTQVEAGTWLLAAQQQFNKSKEAEDKQIEEIAELQLDLKDQADIINEKYGKILKENTDLRDEIWEAFQKTLVKDEKSGLIVKTTVPLETFYNLALKGYAQAPAAPVVDEAAQAAEAAKAAAEAEKQRAQNRADRGDIYGGGKPDAGLTQDEKEWADAANEVFGNQLK